MSNRVNSKSNSSTVQVVNKKKDKETEEKVLVLKLEVKREVTWDENTEFIDENSGKRKSKNCCIYSKKSRYEDSDTLSDESEDNYNAHDRVPRDIRRKNKEKKHKNCNHEHKHENKGQETHSNKNI